MALLWIDGFDNYGTTAGSAPSPAGIVGRKYPTIYHESNFYVRIGRLAGYALDLSYDNSPYFGVTGLTTNDTVVVGFAVKLVLSNDITFFSLYDGTTQGVCLAVQTTGEIKVKRGSTLLGTTAGLGLVASNWYYIELKVKCAGGTSGTYELRVGGANVCSSAGANTQAGSDAYHDGFRFNGMGVNATMCVDDFYLLDASGAANNDFLGNMRVTALRPDSAGDSTQFTPDSGNNYARVNEAVCGDDTNYVEDATSTHVDLYNYDALSGITSGIKGVMVCTDCRETDGTSFSLKTECKSGTTTSDDAGQVIGSTNYVTKRRILEVDPDTAVAWIKTGLDAAQFGVKVG